MSDFILNCFLVPTSPFLSKACANLQVCKEPATFTLCCRRACLTTHNRTPSFPKAITKRNLHRNCWGPLAGALSAFHKQLAAYYREESIRLRQKKL